jgi:hypothetical protein
MMDVMLMGINITMPKKEETPKILIPIERK